MGDYFVMVEAVNGGEDDGCVAMYDTQEAADATAKEFWAKLQSYEKNKYRVYTAKAKSYLWDEFEAVGFDSKQLGPEAYPKKKSRRYVEAFGQNKPEDEWALLCGVTVKTVRKWVKLGLFSTRINQHLGLGA